MQTNSCSRPAFLKKYILKDETEHSSPLTHSCLARTDRLPRVAYLQKAGHTAAPWHRFVWTSVAVRPGGNDLSWSEMKSNSRRRELRGDRATGALLISVFLFVLEKDIECRSPSKGAKMLNLVILVCLGAFH